MATAVALAMGESPKIESRKMIKLPDMSDHIWFNSAPLRSEDLKGKVVLYDFWTYSCVNCQRTFPYLRKWWDKYKDKGLILIGIHTPEFEFEKNPKNVEAALKEFNITWPVVLDNNYFLWDNFANRFWPAKYLVDKEGDLVYTHFGEGNYAETEKAIQALLKDVSFPTIVGLPRIEPEPKTTAVCIPFTPETYCGYSRGRISNPGGYYQDRINDYVSLEVIAQDTIALQGKFLATREYVQSEEEGATLYLNFRATEVNLVMKPANDRATIEIMLNGKRLKELTIESATMYNLIKSKTPLSGILSIKAVASKFQAYVFYLSINAPGNLL